MRCHDHIHFAGINEPPERFEFLFFPSAGDVGQPEVGVGIGTSMSGEVLYGAEYPVFVMGVDCPAGIVGDGIDIGGETAMESAYYRAVLVDVDIKQRRKVDVQSYFFHFFGDASGIFQGCVPAVDAS